MHIFRRRSSSDRHDLSRRRDKRGQDMTNATSSELKLEQEYFDAAWDARERKRRTLKDAPVAAAGSRAAVSAVKRGADRLLDQIGAPDEAVAFGRFDLADGECVYIGKNLISDDSRTPLVINWQAPFAAPYFEARYDDARGLARRRKFFTTRNKVDDFEEVLFEDLARRVGDLTSLEQAGIDDAVLRDLEQDRTGEMRDIVQTIHSSQYGLVQAPLEQLLIVQGGPGTGKTAVALHRASWLLFNHRDRLAPSQVLVVGPNATFTRYIKSVLPGLGDADVSHLDLRSLGPQVSSGRAENLATVRIKGDSRMAELLDRALMQRIRVPDRLDVLTVGPESGGARFSPQEIAAALARYSASGTYASARVAFRAWLAQEASRRYAGSVSPTQVESAVERVWPSLTPQAFLRDLLGSRERLLAAAGDDFTAGEVGRLLRPAAEKLSAETWSDADIALLDEADALITGPGRRFLHIIVDEAQDLTPMQLRSVRRRSMDGSMTLVGDLAQSTGVWARDSWADVAEALEKAHPVVIAELGYGYRVPRQVFALAERLLPEAAPGVTPPRVVREGPAEPQLEQVDADDRILRTVQVAQERAGQGLFVGIVCPDSLRVELVKGLASKGVRYSDASKGSLGASINLVSPLEAKGLEFDSVVVLEPEAIVEEYDRGLRMLYVALTRTTRYLAVVHAGRLLPLSEGAPDDAGVSPASTTPSLELETALVELGSEQLVMDLPASAQGVLSEVVTQERELATAVPSQRPPAEAQPVVAAPLSKTGPVALNDLGDVIVSTVVQTLAETVRGTVPANLWPKLVDRLSAELGVEPK